MRNITLSKMVKGESGQALIIVLVMMLVGVLIIPPTLNVIRTGLVTERVSETRTNEYYGADAGVERVMVWLKDNQADPSVYPQHTQVYSFPSLSLNGKKVCVTLNYSHPDAHMNSVFVITSLSGPNIVPLTDMDSDHDKDIDDLAAWLAAAEKPYTKVVSYVTDATGNFEELTRHVITTPGDTIEGLKQSDVIPASGENGPVTQFIGPWPKASQLSRYYWEDVKNSLPMPSPSSMIDVKTDPVLGPLYRNGSLSIKCTASGTPVLTLNDTVYITGDVVIGATDKQFILDLNGQTLYVESDTGAGVENQYALEFGTKCTLKGPGCIIAVGSINFQPTMIATQDYILILSLTGKTLMHPQGNFYGTLAGSTLVALQPGCTACWITPPADILNLPGYEVGRFWTISSWQISYK